MRWPIADGTAVIATLSPEPDETRPAPPSQVLAGWDVALPARGRWEATVEVTATAPGGPPVAAPPTRELWWAPAVSAGDHRLPALVERSVADLAGLLAADPAATDDHYLTAGAPWYLTLFGRDSLWAARMALPLGTDLAAGTLRTLARRQGTRTDPSTEEEPGKILHEVRATSSPAGPRCRRLLRHRRRDAAVDLAAARRLALGPGRRRGARRCCPTWRPRSAGCGTATGGRLRPLRRQTGRRPGQPGLEGLGDSIQFADGRLAEPPIALCEVQAYAYAAAMEGAALLDAFGRPGGDGWRDWAAGLRDRFRRPFWVEDPPGAIPAIALDGDGRPVDSVTSNIGHLLGTGFLDAAETAAVVAPAGGAGHGRRLRAAHDVVALGRVQPAELPRRVGVGARHGDRAARAGRGRHGGRRSRATSLARGLLAAAAGVRLPAAGAVRRRVGRRRPVAAGLPGGVPAAGVVGRSGAGRAHRDPRADPGRCRPVG